MTAFSPSDAARTAVVAGNAGCSSSDDAGARVALQFQCPAQLACRLAYCQRAASIKHALSRHGRKALHDAAVVAESFRYGKPGQVQIPEGVEPGARIQVKAPGGDAWLETTTSMRFVVFSLGAWLVMVCS